MKKVFNIYYSIGKKTFQIIYQLPCFVGHPVSAKMIVQKLLILFEKCLIDFEFVQSFIKFYKINILSLKIVEI